MFELPRLRKKHGDQAVPDLRKATLPINYRAFPMLDENKCDDGCQNCFVVCPTGAIKLNSFQLDLGKCIFCGECQRECPKGAILFSNRHFLATTSRDNLKLSSVMDVDTFEKNAIVIRNEIKRLFGHSLKLRQVSAGGCNGCESELLACGNVNFDMGRFGIEFVASPRHADGIVITGPITKNMAPALKDAILSISEPRLVIVAGACAISGGVFADSSELERSFYDEFNVDLYIPGCPPHPLTIINGLLKLIGKG